MDKKWVSLRWEYALAHILITIRTELSHFHMAIPKRNLTSSLPVSIHRRFIHFVYMHIDCCKDNHTKDDISVNLFSVYFVKSTL
jgi:phage terminase Nu1 subunit (DNA packaging protein)